MRNIRKNMCPECGSTYLHCTASVTVSYRFYPSPSANVAYGEPLGSPEVAEDSPVTCRRCSHQGERRTPFYKNIRELAAAA